MRLVRPTKPLSRRPTRFGDVRTLALAGALCMVVNAVTGFTNRSLRGRVAGLLGSLYPNPGDLRPPSRQAPWRDRATPGHQHLPRHHRGHPVAVFYTKLRERRLGPLLDADQPPATTELRRALSTIDHAIADYVTNAVSGPPLEACHNVMSLEP